MKKNPLWRFLSSTQLAVVLLIVFTLSSILGTLLPQMTPDLAGEAHIRWLTLAHDKYGALADLYRTLGLFNVYRAAWFRLIVVALVVNVAVCTIDRLGGIWRAISARPRVKQQDTFYEGMTHRAVLSIAAEGVEEAVKTVLSRRRYRLLTEQEGDTAYLYADRHRWARLGTVCTHLGLILIVAAVFWRGLSAWREDEVVLGPGQVYAPGRGLDFQVRNDGFKVERYPDGRPRDYLSHLTILEAGRETAYKTVRINEPLTYRGLSFYLSSYGPVQVPGTSEVPGTLEAQNELEYYIVLMAVHDPSFGPLIVASFLMVVGLVVSFYFPHRRIWARVRGGQVSLAGLTDRDAVGFEGEFKTVVRWLDGR